MRSERERQPLIVGYGSTLRGDDGVGPLVAHRLAAEGWDAVAVHQLAPELAERIAAACLVLFVDADADLAPGEVCTTMLLAEADGILHHYSTPESLLAIAQAAYGRAPEAFMVGIGVESFELGEHLSKAAEAGAEEALRTIRAVSAAAGR